ncbi:MAG: DNA polymerase I, partial [Marinomonas sp.]
MAEKQHLYLVDGSSYIFRAYHRLPPLTNPEGTPVGAVYGYTTMLWKLAEDLDSAKGPTHLAVILDASGKSFRNDIYPEYKANRPPAPEDLVPQFPLIRDATRAFSLPCIEEHGLEADDLIASYARAAQDKGWDVTIVSSDKDLMQLIGEKDGPDGPARIDMLDTMKNQRIYLDEVHEKFGVTPDLVGDVLALMGDAVDNVPGIYGIGPKTASKLIAEHGSLNAALDFAPEMKKSKLKERLLEGREQADLSRILVALKEDAALPEPLDDLKLDGVPEEPLADFLQTHGFSSLLKRLGAGKGSPDRRNDLNPPKKEKAGDAGTKDGSAQALPDMPAVDRSAYETVQTLDRLKEWAARATKARAVAVDTETNSLNAMQADLVGVSLALGPNDACYIPLAHGGTDLLAETPEQIDIEAAIAALKPMLEDASVLKIGQNIKYDINVLARYGTDVAPIEDTMVMSFALDAGRGEAGMGGGHGMDDLSIRHLGHTCLSFKEVCGTGKKAIPFGEVDLPRATEYAAEDADVTWRLYHVLKPRLSSEGGTKIYGRVDRPLVAVVAGMEREGIKVDRAKLAGLSTEFAGETARLEGEIHEAAGEEFAIGSPKQLGDILFEKRGNKGGKKGKSGQYSTDQSVLERLAGDGEPIAKKVLEWRQLAKLKSTYTDALQAAINPKTGRVHTSYMLAGAQTGRLSSTDPNLQNIPIRTAIGRQIREAFVPEAGNVLLAADYSQIELRLAAHMADVGTLKEAFANGEDIHSRTATEMFGEVTRDTRAQAK